jgi:hypothetical protein
VNGSPITESNAIPLLLINLSLMLLLSLIFGLGIDFGRSVRASTVASGTGQWRASRGESGANQRRRQREQDKTRTNPGQTFVTSARTRLGTRRPNIPVANRSQINVRRFIARFVFACTSQTGRVVHVVVAS